jgi:8-hydroxy-5-deazaflavin:NADPH oxidoreductase
MKIGIIGAGRIGGGIARQLAAAEHHIKLSFSRDPQRLQALADELGKRASVGTPEAAVRFGETVVIAVPWSELPNALEQAGSLAGKIVIDTTNQFGSPPLPANGETAAHFNASRMPGALYTKSFNALTAGFQARAANRADKERVVHWLCGDDQGAKQVVAELIVDAGFVPIDLGGITDCAIMEAPRRPGAVYGEEYRLRDAIAVLRALHEGRPVPPTPRYAPVTRRPAGIYDSL